MYTRTNDARCQCDDNDAEVEAMLMIWMDSVHAFPMLVRVRQRVRKKSGSSEADELGSKHAGSQADLTSVPSNSASTSLSHQTGAASVLVRRAPISPATSPRPS